MVTIPSIWFSIKLNFYIWFSQQPTVVSQNSIRRVFLQMEAHIFCELRTYLMCNIDSFWSSCQLGQVSVVVLDPRANAELFLKNNVELRASYVAHPKINVQNFRQNTAPPN
jgi:hypothetical protein